MSDVAGPEKFGRVDDDGTVFVLVNGTERSVGQVPDVSQEEAMAFFVRRYEGLETNVKLLEDRVAAGSLAPEEARKRIQAEKELVTDAHAVGDLASLNARLDALLPIVEQQTAQASAAKEEAARTAKASKQGMVEEAERLAQSNDWRGGVNRFRALLEEWKALPRVDRATDEELWHRFSSARTTYTRRRKAHFAEQDKKRAAAQIEKERIIAEATPLATSTDWGPTAGAFRDLMNRWKAAGPAPRAVDDQLWATFRGLQDTFFQARTAAQSEQDEEFRSNLVAKEELLAAAESEILPVSDVSKARAQYREFLDKYHALGKVPRDSIRSLEGRVRAIDEAIKKSEESEWRRTDPQARQRALDTVNTFSAQIERLNKQAAEAEAAGNDRKAKEAREAIATYQTWLTQAQAALDEFSA